MSACHCALNHRVINILTLRPTSALTVTLNNGRAVCQACFVLMVVLFVSFSPIVVKADIQFIYVFESLLL